MHFGYNCKNYLPVYEKCLKLIEERKKQKELLEIKWLSLKEAVIYSDFFKLDLLDMIEKKKIKIKRKGDKISIGIIAAWGYDECHLAHSGGQCMYFSKHDSFEINYLAETNNVEKKHPNMPHIPDKDELENFKRNINKIVDNDDSEKNIKQLF